MRSMSRGPPNDPRYLTRQRHHEYSYHVQTRRDRENDRSVLQMITLLKLALCHM